MQEYFAGVPVSNPRHAKPDLRRDSIRALVGAAEANR
jgi:hypothetical protein